VPYGGGSGVCGGAVPLLGGITIDTKRMQQLRAVHSAELICDVEAGMSGGAVRARAGAARLHVRALPVVDLFYCSMVGGLVATHERAAGPLSMTCGNVRIARSRAEPFRYEDVAGTFIGMRAWLAMFVTVTACGYPPLQDLVDANVNGDASIDSLPDSPMPQFGTFIKVAFSSPSDVPTTPLMWTSNINIDTDGSTLCDTHNNQATRYCVVAATNITLASNRTLTAHGSKPLVLLAISTFDLQGVIDVSSQQGSLPGAGAAAATSCLNTTAAAGNSGGFGGSFGGKGGNGGAISGTTPDGIIGTPAPALAALPTELRGGCPGGTGSSTMAGVAPVGGSGGGAVAIIAEVIQMNGTINASGAGGKGGPATQSGGGGGGSGGMIVLDAPSIMPGTGTPWLFANGGGGGQGGTGTGTGAGAGPMARNLRPHLPVL
jgi:hypothetical protein